MVTKVRNLVTKIFPHCGYHSNAHKHFNINSSTKSLSRCLVTTAELRRGNRGGGFTTLNYTIHKKRQKCSVKQCNLV